MGLLKQIDKFGMTVEGGYHKITALRFDEPEQITAIVSSYASKTAADNKEQALDKVAIQTDLSACGATKASMNIKKAYAGVKADERFTDAVDEI